MKDLVLVYQWYSENDWYGDRYRAILSISENVGFQSRTEINKFRTKFKKFIIERYKNKKWNLPLKIINKNLIIGERKEFVKYIHCSNGPSLYYNHRNINIEDLPDLPLKSKKKPTFTRVKRAKFSKKGERYGKGKRVR